MKRSPLQVTFLLVWRSAHNRRSFFASTREDDDFEHDDDDSEPGEEEEEDDADPDPDSDSHYEGATSAATLFAELEAVSEDFKRFSPN